MLDHVLSIEACFAKFHLSRCALAVGSSPRTQAFHTIFLGSSPHHSIIWLLQQEANRHEGDAFVLVHKNWHPATITLVHILVLDLEHARYAGATQVHIQDPHLQTNGGTKLVSPYDCATELQLYPHTKGNSPLISVIWATSWKGLTGLSITSQVSASLSPLP